MTILLFCMVQTMQFTPQFKKKKKKDYFFFFLYEGGTGKKQMSHRKQNYMSSRLDLHYVLLINPSTTYYWIRSRSLILGKRISVENSESHKTVNCFCLFFIERQ